MILEPASQFWMDQKWQITIDWNMKKCPERFLDLTNRFSFLELLKYVIFGKIEHHILKISHIYIDIQKGDGLPPLKKAVREVTGFGFLFVKKKTKLKNQTSQDSANNVT